MRIDENQWVLRVLSSGKRLQWLQLRNPGVPPIFTHDLKLALTFPSKAEARAMGENLGLHPETKADAAKGAPRRIYDDWPPSSIRRANPREPDA
jgi:hypothetical protein